MSMDKSMNLVMSLQDSLASELSNLIQNERLNLKSRTIKKGVRDSGSLFTREALKGGPIETREIVEAYINANRALFGVKKNFSQDLNAARILGISEEAYEANVDISNLEKKCYRRRNF